MFQSTIASTLERPSRQERWHARARRRRSVWAALACLICGGCEGATGNPSGLVAAGNAAGPAGTGSAAGNVAPAGAAGRTGAAAAGGATAGAAADSGMAATDPTRLPARLRRLTNAEFDASVRALLNIDADFGASFTPDTRQGGFTRNDAQRVDPVFITQLNDAAQRSAALAKADVSTLAPCADGADAAASEGCAREFAATFSERAYRRLASPREVDALLAVYRAASEGASYADGIEAMISAVLQSPGFLYVTEIGQQPSAAGSQLTEHEIASALAYLLTGAPPDAALLQAAAAGSLSEADVRRENAQRLLATDAAKTQVVRMVHEWLGIDRISETAKDSNVYPQFAGLRDAMKREADAFVTEVLWKSESDVRELFAADWTLAEDDLARMYLNSSGGEAPARTEGRVSLAGVRRRGVLNQGAFLSVYAHATETAPVLRGVALLRRMLCVNIPSPTTLNLNVVPPVPDPTKTTRERFSVHSQDAACAGCHDSIDAIGFSFEGLDGMGRERQTENGRPIDSHTSLMGGYSFDGDYADSAELALRLADSAELERCFARQLFRYAAARSDASSQPAEDAYLSEVESLPAEARGKFAELIEAFVASDAFVQRGANP
jgi:Protein of unknown function (DUF1592)/Protein of unknown function (DUF1588)/Protein of unknown function (DUF1595)/Protein of unknown function (DUF1587)/Protein of unknown function (DUF1585)